MPSERSTIIVDQELSRRVGELEKELSEARDQHTATAEILAALSRSPSEPLRVFSEIAAAAARLCDGYNTGIFRRDGDSLVLIAHHGPVSAVGPVGHGTLPLIRGLPPARAVLERQTVHVADLQAETSEYPEGSDFARRLGFRAALAVPLVRANEAIGVITIRRIDARPFTNRQIDILRTFADQAVIAIENTRLFEAEQASKRELQQSLEYQTAIGDVLAVISRSPNELQPVLEAIVETARRLCGSDRAIFFQLRNDRYHLVAQQGTDPEFVAWVRDNPMSPEEGSGSTVGRAARERRTIHVPDLARDPEYTESPIQRRGRARSRLAVPLLRGDVVFGVILVARDEVRPFTDRQIKLVETFADQALIAIENTRLFEAEQASKRDLRESLEYQTAISEVLSVISRSPNNLNPVLEAIGKIACRLCAAYDVSILLRRGDKLRLKYLSGPIGGYPIEHDFALTRGYVMGRCVIDANPVHVADLPTEAAEFPEGAANAAELGHRTILAVPLLQADQAVGAIVLRRLEVQPFAASQIALLKTFADQAVIAIQNTRLFEEAQARTHDLQEALDQQTATSEVLSVISSSPGDLKPVFQAMLENATRICDAQFGVLQLYEGGGFRIGAIHNAPPAFAEAMARREPLMHPTPQHPFRRMVTAKAVVQIADLRESPAYEVRDPGIVKLVERASARTFLAVPMLKENEVAGVIAIYRQEVRAFTDKQIAVVVNFANQAVIAIENIRLLNELRESLRQLEIASQHKSQFVANMSHELRTPMAAILGYAELMQEGFYGTPSEKSLDALTRIRSNGKHLLGLINTVLDIAKIESGQFTLNMGEYAVESVVETVRSATESLAQNKRLAFKTEVAKSLPFGLGDEQRLTQVLLNLVGNAIKFTDAGEVRVSAQAVNGNFNVSVADTGPGIPADQLTRIFEQFHQVDSSNTKAKGGTGLGLAISKQIVEMHGGRIWVESILGKGSTFHMELPIRASFRGAA